MSAAAAAAEATGHGAGVSDMVLLRKLSEKSVAKNLAARHAEDSIYTYIGHVLVAVNPFKWITAENGAPEDLYGSKMMRRYERRSRLDAPPHVYAIAEAAYRGMTGEEESQCVIISGESGAGKTEAAKQVMAYIASVSAGRKADVVVTRINRIVSRSNPLLESFGNAMTLRNNNSSRFGKYFRLLFDRFGQPRGGNVINYLLEKSRVVRPARGERNFHIFYQLLRALDAPTKKRLGLNHYSHPKNIHYLAQSGVFTISNEGGTKDDGKEFLEVLAAFDTIGIDARERGQIYEVLASVLHLGNIAFVAKKYGNADGSTPDASGLEAATRAAAIMGVDATMLVRVLTSRRLESPTGEKYVVPLNVPQATDARDAAAKALYAQLFDYLVVRVNDALTAAQASGDERAGSGAGGADDDSDEDEELSIGVLDIYGFEVFEQNSFEQLCINFVNEKLQQIFIELCLKAEQVEYATEGIAWSPVPFFNNEVVCQLIEGTRKSPGVFQILDDTCRTAHAMAGAEVDAKFVDKLAGFQGGHRHFSKTGPTAFTVRHYAGPVTYTALGFVKANKDEVPTDVAALISRSSKPLIAKLFASAVATNSTAGTRIKKQTNRLVKALMKCEPHYVRCIKSNDFKRADCFDVPRVTHQVKYLGLVENIKVRQAGFAFRAEYHRVVERWRLLSPVTWPGPHRCSDKKACLAILKAVARMKPKLRNNKMWAQPGKSKLFIKAPKTLVAIDRLRQVRIDLFVRRIQALWSKYKNKRVAIKLRLGIAALYEKRRKQRNRASISRPFSQFYFYNGEEQRVVVEVLNRYGALNRRYETWPWPWVATAPSAAQAAAAAAGFADEEDRVPDVMEEERVLFADHCARLVTPPKSAAGIAAIAAASRASSGRGRARGGAAASGGDAMWESSVQLSKGVAMEERLLVLTTRSIWLLAHTIDHEAITLPPSSASAAASASSSGGGGAAATKTGDAAAAAAAAEDGEPALAFADDFDAPGATLGGGRDGCRGLHVRRHIRLADVTNVSLSTKADGFAVLHVQQRPAPTGHDPTAHYDKAEKCFATGQSFSLFRRRHHCRLTGRTCVDSALLARAVVPDKHFFTPERIVESAAGLFSTEMCEDQVLYLPERKSEFAATLKYAKQLAQPRANHDAFIKFSDATQLRPSQKLALARTPNAKLTFAVAASARKTVVSLASGGSVLNIAVAGCEGVPTAVVKEREARLRAALKRKAKQAQKDKLLRAQMAEQRNAEREVQRRERIAAKKQAKLDAKDKAAEKKAIKLAKSKAKAAGVAYVAPKQKKKKKKKVPVVKAPVKVSAKTRASRSRALSRDLSTIAGEMPAMPATAPPPLVAEEEVTVVKKKKKKRQITRLRAMYDYTAAREDEMNLVEGDFYLGGKQSKDRQWWLAIPDGAAKGTKPKMIPANYVECV